MIHQRLILSKYNDWVIDAYFAVSTYYTDEIMEHLWYIGVDSVNAERAYKNISKNDLDTGLCYSNYRKRKSVIVVALTSSATEFFNSVVHEVSHACVHISDALGINHKSEEFNYLMGDICRELYPKIKHLLCDCCRNDYDYE